MPAAGEGDTEEAQSRGGASGGGSDGGVDPHRDRSEAIPRQGARRDVAVEAGEETAAPAQLRLGGNDEQGEAERGS